MQVKDIMTADPAFATLDTSLNVVAQMMADHDCGCIPVIENETNRKPIGVITDRDIVIRTIAHHKNPLNLTAGEIMTDFVISVTPDVSVEECVMRMEKNQLRRAVVVDDSGDLVGMVAQADIAREAPSVETAELVQDVSLPAIA